MRELEEFIYVNYYIRTGFIKEVRFDNTCYYIPHTKKVTLWEKNIMIYT